jgi:glycosyltransferase involved in cell wall biosynthesis
VKPLLSICIPTYNRAETLRLMLQSIIPQVNEVRDAVELIVSDNCSTDHTPEVVQWAMQFGAFRCHRNKTNIGATRNILLLSNELAEGEFCWILGDDDMIIQGKLPKIIESIKNNAEMDYFYVNHCETSVVERNRIILEDESRYSPLVSECFEKDFSDYRLARWEELCKTESIDDAVRFTCIVCHILRTKLWRRYRSELNLGADSSHSFHNFDSTFPHIAIVARAMVGRPVYYLGDPCVLLGQESQEWIGWWPAIYLIRIGEAMDLYKSLGVEEKYIRRLRDAHYSHGRDYLIRMMTRPDLPGRQDFSLTKYLWTNHRHLTEIVPLLHPFLGDWIEEHGPPGVYRVLRFLKRIARLFSSGGPRESEATCQDTVPSALDASRRDLE